MPPNDLKNTHPLPTVLLWHETAEGSHHDWMLADPTLQGPDAPEHSLWTARVWPPSSQWRDRGAFELVPLPYHRKTYLTYEGPISGDRGEVTRVDEGTFEAIKWDLEFVTRMLLRVSMRQFTGHIEISKAKTGIWRGNLVATVLPAPKPIITPDKGKSGLSKRAVFLGPFLGATNYSKTYFESADYLLTFLNDPDAYRRITEAAMKEQIKLKPDEVLWAWEAPATDSKPAEGGLAIVRDDVVISYWREWHR